MKKPRILDANIILRFLTSDFDRSCLATVSPRPSKAGDRVPRSPYVQANSSRHALHISALPFRNNGNDFLPLLAALFPDDPDFALVGKSFDFGGVAFGEVRNLVQGDCFTWSYGPRDA